MELLLPGVEQHCHTAWEVLGNGWDKVPPPFCSPRLLRAACGSTGRELLVLLSLDRGLKGGEKAKPCTERCSSPILPGHRARFLLPGWDMSRAIRQALNQQAFGRTELESKRAGAVLNAYMVLISFIEMFNVCHQQTDVCLKSTKLCACPRSWSSEEAGAALHLLRTASSWEVSLCVFGLHEHSLPWLLQPRVFPALNHSYLSWSNDNPTCTPGNWVTF